jgi:hypothetical protein
MGPNIQVLIIVGTIICFSSISYARPGEWKNGTATFYKRPYVHKYVCVYIYIIYFFETIHSIL